MQEAHKELLLNLPKKNQHWFLKTFFILVALILLVAIGGLSSYLLVIHQSNGSIISSGEKRDYELHVPESYQGDTPVPLVISLHGFAEWPAHQRRMTHWDELADEYGFIVVYPAGRQVPKRWMTHSLTDQSDAQFIADLIDHLQQNYNIDPLRIYANGLSNGGGMSFYLSCTLSGRIAAFGGVAGAYLLPLEDCSRERPVPAILFHGNADPIVPFEGGPSHSFEIDFPVITAWVQQLAEKNGCETTPVSLPAQGEASGWRYTGCETNAEVVYYIIDGGGHTWPGGDSLPRWIAGQTTQDIDATRLMWEFFQQHSLDSTAADK